MAESKILERLSPLNKFVIQRAKKSFTVHAKKCPHRVSDNSEEACIHSEGGPACLLWVCPKIMRVENNFEKFSV